MSGVNAPADARAISFLPQTPTLIPVHLVRPSMKIAPTANLLECTATVKERDHREHSVETRKYRAISGEAKINLYVKPLTKTPLVNELVAAWCGRQLSLHCAQPYLVEPSELWPVGVHQRLFGTAAFEWPALHTLNLDQKQKVLGGLEFAEVFVFDVLVANLDRADANLLCDSNRCFAFDHDQAFFGLHRTADELRANVDCLPNLFLPAQLPLDFEGAAPPNIHAVATRWKGMQVNFDELDELTSIISREEIDAIKAFLYTRLSNLQSLVERAISLGE